MAWFQRFCNVFRPGRLQVTSNASSRSTSANGWRNYGRVDCSQRGSSARGAAAIRQLHKPVGKDARHGHQCVAGVDGSKSET